MELEHSNYFLQILSMTPAPYSLLPCLLWLKSYEMLNDMWHAISNQKETQET
jgi:hypothetical protein